MVEEQCALDVSDRDFGRRPKMPVGCFHRSTQQEADS